MVHSETDFLMTHCSVHTANIELHLSMLQNLDTGQHASTGGKDEGI